MNFFVNDVNEVEFHVVVSFSLSLWMPKYESELDSVVTVIFVPGEYHTVVYLFTKCQARGIVFFSPSVSLVTLRSRHCRTCHSACEHGRGIDIDATVESDKLAEPKGYEVPCNSSKL